MKHYLLLVFSWCFLFLNGQQLLPIQYDTTLYSHELIINGVGDYSSSSIENDFSNRFLFGGDITQEIKDKSFNRHKGINRFGIDLSGEIEYRNMKAKLFGKENWAYLIKGGYYNYLSCTYSKEIFGLAFYGNEQYLGTGIDFSGSRISSMSFQKVGFGFIDKKTKSNISFNLYSVSDYMEAMVKDGYLFQSESGDSISLTLDGSFEYSSENQFLKGYGIGVDLDFKIPVMLQENKTSYIQFLVKNIGIAHLFSDVTRYSVDTTIYYDGLTFDDLLNENELLNDDFSLLTYLGIDSTVVSKFRFLPGFLQVGKIVDEHNTSRVQSFFGIRMYPSIAFSPMIYAGAHIKAISKVHFGLNVSYGGYTNLRFGLYSQISLKKFSIGISSEDFVGLVSKRGLGESLIFRLRYKV